MMTSNPETDLHTLTGAYALDALDDDERAAFEAHLDGCESCRAEVAGFRETAALLAHGTASEPPAQLRAAVLEQIDETRQLPPKVVPLRQRPPWVLRSLAVAAVLLGAVSIGLAISNGDLRGELEQVRTELAQGRDADLEELLREPDLVRASGTTDGAQVQVLASPTRNEGVVLTEGLSSPPEGEGYHLWLLDGQDGPTPAGVIQVGADGTGRQTLTGDLSQATGLGVTLEPVTGADAPTVDPLLMIDLPT